jgi:hypothetical protein
VPPKLWSMLLSLRLSSDIRRQSSKTTANPGHYLIFVHCNNSYCNAPKEMLFNGTEELGCNRYSVRPGTRKWQAARNGRRGHNKKTFSVSERQPQV